MVPKTALEVHEESWNAYPRTKTKFSVPFVEKFTLEIDTVFQQDGGTQVRGREGGRGRERERGRDRDRDRETETETETERQRERQRVVVIHNMYCVCSLCCQCCLA